MSGSTQFRGAAFALALLLSPVLAADAVEPADSLPPGAVARFGTVRLRQPGGVRCLVFSPNGTLLASGGRGGTVYLWSTSSGQLVRRFRAETVTTLAFSPDGKRLASACVSDKVRLWDAATGNELAAWDGPTGGYWQDKIAMAFTPDAGRLVCAGGDGFAHVWDIASGKRVGHFKFQLHDAPGDISALALTSRADVLACAYPPYAKDPKVGLVGVWDVATGQLRYRVEQPDGRLDLLAFSPDGRQLAHGVRPGTVTLRETATGKAVGRLKGTVRSLAFAAAGALAIADDNGSLGLLDRDTGKYRPGFRPPPAQADVLALSPDGKVMAAAREHGHLIRLFDTATGAELHAVAGHEDAIHAVAFFPDGKTLVSSSEHGPVRFWATPSGKPLPPPPWEKPPRGLALLLRDGMTFAQTHFESIALRSVATGETLRTLKTSYTVSRRFAVAPDGRSVAVDDRGVVCLFDTASGKQRSSLSDPTDPIYTALTFAPDSKSVVTADYRSLVAAWDGTTGKRQWRIDTQQGQVHAVAVSPDGRIVACGGGGSVALLDAATGTERERVPLKGVVVRALAWSPDGRFLVQEGGDNVICLREAMSSALRCRFAGHLSYVSALAFSPSGRYLASGSDDATVLLWEVAAASSGQTLSAKEIESAWDDLATADGACVHRAVGGLIAAGGRAVALLREKLRPAAAVDERRFHALIANLDSPRFQVRRRATEELEKLEESAAPLLRAVLAGTPSEEVRRRVEEVLRRLGWRPLTGEALRAWRALEVLERAGGAEARALLRDLAGGAPGARLTREARAALTRLEARASGR